MDDNLALHECGMILCFGLIINIWYIKFAARNIVISATSIYRLKSMENSQNSHEFSREESIFPRLLLLQTQRNSFILGVDFSQNFTGVSSYYFEVLIEK